MTKIALKKIHKKYDNAKDYSVVDFNLDIQENEFIVFVGPSGCGKSTTLRMIAGLEDITEGELYIDSKLMNDVPPKDRDIAMVFQNYALYPHMTVYDNMAFGLQLRKVPKSQIDEKVKNAADILGLTEYLKRKPADLSGGQRQRVALGRAIVRNANIFLMDEPLSNLDAKLRVQMRTEIAKLHHDLKTTTIYVTHDQTEAMTMADRIVVMKDGYVQQIGTPEEIYDKPANVFVGEFIGSPAMNFFNVIFNGEMIRLGNRDIPLLPFQTKLLANHIQMGDQVIIGIRPEDLDSEQISLDLYPESTIQAKVVVSEMLGSETLLYMEYQGQDVVAKVDKRDARQPDEEIQLALNLSNLHFFDVETQLRIQ